MMWACGFFVARVPGATRPEMAGASSVFVVLFALPSYVALWRWAGARSALQVLVALGVFALGIETVAVATGWPYGAFSYGDAIGGKVAGLVPWTVPFAWTPLVLGTHAFALRTRPHPMPSKRPSKRPSAPSAPSAPSVVLWGTLALAAADLVLDPGAVRQKFWSYAAGGLYYGVPASNYLGWLLSGVAGHTMLTLVLRSHITKSAPNPERAPTTAANLPRHTSVGSGLQKSKACAPIAPGLAGQAPSGLGVSLGWTLCFWSSVCLWAGLWAPATVGHLCLLALWSVLGPSNSSRQPPQPQPRPEPAEAD